MAQKMFRIAALSAFALATVVASSNLKAAASCRDCFDFTVHNDTRYDAEITVQRQGAVQTASADAGHTRRFTLGKNETYALKAYFKRPGSRGFTMANAVGSANATWFLSKGRSATLVQRGSEANHDLEFSWR